MTANVHVKSDVNITDDQQRFLVDNNPEQAGQSRRLMHRVHLDDQDPKVKIPIMKRHMMCPAIDSPGRTVH